MELQNYMIQTLKEWVINTGIDGFRFDYVDGVPPSFWTRAVAELKALKPDIFLLAEGEGVKYHTMGFDMDYNWGLYGWGKGLSRQIFEGTKTVAHLDSFMNTTKNNYMPDKYQMYFTSNHDENSWEGTEFEQLGASAEVFAVLTQTFYGMPLVYSGQEVGLNKRLDFFDKNEIDWSNLVYSNLYSTLNNLRDTNCAMWLGSNGAIPVRINTSLNSQVFAYSRSKEKSEILVFLNLSATNVSFTLTDKGYSSLYQDIFSGSQIILDTHKTISLKAWDYLILVK
jgi:glycosidase